MTVVSDSFMQTIGPAFIRLFNGAADNTFPLDLGNVKRPCLKILEAISRRFTIIALAVAGLALAVNLLLATGYVMELRQQQMLASEIAATRQTLSGYSGPVAIQQQLTEAEVALVNEQGAFRPELSGAQVTGELLGLAESRDLTVIEAGSQPGETRELGQRTYEALLVTIQVSGTLEAFRVFLEDLERGSLSGAKISQVTVKDIAAASSGTPSSGSFPSSPPKSRQTLVASVDISVYERRGGAD